MSDSTENAVKRIAYVIKDHYHYGIREVDTAGILWTIVIGSDNGGRQFINYDGAELENCVDWFWTKEEAEREIERLKG